MSTTAMSTQTEAARLADALDTTGRPGGLCGAAAAELRRLESDRDSWIEQCSQRVADWHEEHEKVKALEQEIERLKLSRIDRECLRIGQELQRAAGKLPEGFSIEVAVELGSGCVTLIDEDYKTQDFNDTVDGLSHCITQAIDAALTSKEPQ